MNYLEVARIMLPAFAMCLVLVGIHSYLGIHVIKRKVIFVDLALAQIAALGTLVAFLFGIMPHTPGSYWFSLGLTAVAAGIFSVCRFREGKIPQEAIIGLVYAIAFATSILLIDKAPHGAEHLKDITTGNILWVKWESVLVAAVVYSVVGVLHYACRKQFILISEDPDKAYAQGLSVRLWDFLFYLSFGLVITISVSSAGVLIVFVFLVAPSIISLLLMKSWLSQIVFGWALGAVVTIIGLVLSYLLDLPTGPAVIGVYGVVMVIISVGHYIRISASKSQAVRNAVITGVVFALAFAAITWIALALKNISGDRPRREKAIHGEKAPDALEKLDIEKLAGKLDEIRDIGTVVKLYENADDGGVKSAAAVRALELEKGPGAALALDFLGKDYPLFHRQSVVDALSQAMGEPLDYDVMKPHSDPVNQAAVHKVKARFGLGKP